MTGMVFRDTRAGEILRVHEAILRARKRQGIKYLTVSPKIVVRILQVFEDQVRIISVDDPSADDEIVPRAFVRELIIAGDWVMSPCEPVKTVRLGDRLSKSQQVSRNRNMSLIGDLIAMGVRMFDRVARAKIVKATCIREKLDSKLIQKVFRRYLQGGMVPNAVANRGMAGIAGDDGQRRRILCTAEVRAGVPKPRFGRPRKDGKKGFLVAQGDEEKIIRGAVKHFHTALGGNWHRAWLLTISESYLEIEPHSKVPLDVQLRKYTPDTYPSINQFRYWAETDHEVVSLLKKRLGEKSYNLNSRPLHGRTESHAGGPGSIFMIDGTRLDVVIVHCVTRRPIGRPQLYLVVDVFSHLIVGFSISLENAGYDASVGAILSCARNKQELCREFGVEIDPGEWPAACIPDLLVGDSEIATLQHAKLVESKMLNFRVVPAYRPDLKGLVESLYAALNKTTIHHLPGRSSGQRFRCEPNPDHLAVIDLPAINRIVINYIRRHNLTVNKDYQMTEAMVADGMVPTPQNLWNWGEINCGGLRRVWDNELLKRMCFPTDVALINRRGLAFSGVFYVPVVTADLPEFELWRTVESGNASRRVTITRNPLRVDRVWLHHEDRLVAMKLAEESALYSEWTIDDLAAYIASRNADLRSGEAGGIAKLAILEKQTFEEVKIATQITDAVRGKYAQRRLEKTDKAADRANEKDRQDGSAFIQKELKKSTNSPPTAMADDDERELVKRLQNNSDKK